MSNEAYEDARARAIALLTDEEYEGYEDIRELISEATAKNDSRVDAVQRMVDAHAIGYRHNPDQAAEILVAQL